MQTVTGRLERGLAAALRSAENPVVAAGSEETTTRVLDALSTVESDSLTGVQLLLAEDVVDQLPWLPRAQLAAHAEGTVDPPADIRVTDSVRGVALAGEQIACTVSLVSSPPTVVVDDSPPADMWRGHERAWEAATPITVEAAPITEWRAAVTDAGGDPAREEWNRATARVRAAATVDPVSALVWSAAGAEVTLPPVVDAAETRELASRATVSRRVARLDDDEDVITAVRDTAASEGGRPPRRLFQTVSLDDDPLPAYLLSALE